MTALLTRRPGRPPAPTAGASSPAAPGRLSKPAAGLTAALLGVAVWQVLSLVSDDWVPGIDQVALAVAGLVTDAGFYGDALISLRRVLIVLLAASFLGLLIGLITGLSRNADAFVRPVLVIGLAIPDPVYIILVILIMGVNETAGVVALIVAIAPLVANVVSGSVRSRDRGLDEMARTYRLGRGDYARHVLAWQVRPAAVGALKTSFAFSWKLVVLMETMTQPDGVGARIYESFRFLRPEDMIAYALLFTVLMRVLEGLALRGIDRPHPH